MPQIHPDPILSPSVVKNALFDSDLCFPIFHFPNFPLFLPPFRVVSRFSRAKMDWSIRSELKTYPLKLKSQPCGRLNFSLAIGSPFPPFLLYDKDLSACLACLLSVRQRARG